MSDFDVKNIQKKYINHFLVVYFGEFYQKVLHIFYNSVKISSRKIKYRFYAT